MKRLPWGTHIVTAVVVFPLLLALTIPTPGLVRHDPYPLGFMSFGILASAWVLALPLVVVEVWSGLSRFGWVTRGTAFAGTALLAVVGSLPVTFRLDADPVTTAEVRSAVSNYLILIGGHLVLIVAAYACSTAIRKRDEPSTSGGDI